MNKRLKTKLYAANTRYVHKLADPGKSGQAVHLAVQIGIGSSRISFADFQFTLSAPADSEYARKCNIPCNGDRRCA